MILAPPPLPILASGIVNTSEIPYPVPPAAIVTLAAPESSTVTLNVALEPLPPVTATPS